MRKRLTYIAGVLSMLAYGCLAYVSPGFAQAGNVSAVKNIDEKGRAPYMQSVPRVCVREQTCDIVFPPVPEGKRLVVERVNGAISLPTSSPRNPTQGLRFTALVAPNLVLFVFPTRPAPDPSLLIANEATLAYFEPGESPIFRTSFTAEFEAVPVYAAISGYLVDLGQ